MLIAASALSLYSIPIAALILSAAALIYSGVGLRQKTQTDHDSGLYLRIDDLEGQVELALREQERLQRRCSDLEKKIADLRTENFDLMKRLLKAENGG